MKKVYVIDDHPAVREGFRAILERSGRYLVSGEAASAEEALAPGGLGPEAELVLVDVSLPGRSGLELASELRRAFPCAKTVVVSMHRRFDYMTKAFRAGAAAYIAKDSGAESLIAALDAAGRGEPYLDPESLRLFVEEASRESRGGQRVRESLEALSEREREVLALFAEGRRAEDIARELALSPKTVENHLSTITGKVGARDRFDLYRLASRWFESRTPG